MIGFARTLKGCQNASPAVRLGRGESQGDAGNQPTGFFNHGFQDAEKHK